MGKKFDKLEHKVEDFYIGKGYSKKRAEKIGYAVAGKVYHEKLGEMVRKGKHKAKLPNPFR
jgi:hypothetical protein